MSSKVDAEKATNEKWKQVKNVVGDKSRDIQSAGHGGWVQICRNGYIYWHANTGAHEVHGEILTSYLRQGGPGPNRKTGKRELGFPTTDELYDRYPISRFEWGAITCVDGRYTSIIKGDLYTYWIKNLEKLNSLGNPISSQIRIDDGDIIFFEFGCIYSGQASGNKPIYCILDLPRIGQPLIADTSPAKRLKINRAIRMSKDIHFTSQLRNVFEQLWDGRMALRPTANKNSIPIELRLSRRDSGMWSLTATETLSDRTLYDIIMTIQGYDPVVLVAHAVYAKESWNSFGFIHSTDLHVNRRTDKFREALKLLGAKVGVEEFVNYNNGLREMIQNANKLYKQGKLDMILATGDLVDYVYEEYDSVNPYGYIAPVNTMGPVGSPPTPTFFEADTPHHSGNFAFLEQLLTGQIKYTNGARGVELLVPIFMTPGNHDYRIHPYKLLFDADIPTWPDHECSNYKSHNLQRVEALRLQDCKTNPTLHRDQAREMIKVDKDNQELYKRIVRDSFYMVRLGPHRVVMIDSRWDAGILKGDWETLKTAAGYGSDDQRNFADGAPNSEGFTKRYNKKLKQAINEAKDSGIFIVCTHAPPINLAKNDYSHFLRETERPFTNEGEIKAYLRRHAPQTGTHYDPNFGWSYPSGWFDKNVGYLKKGDIKGLDYGISKGKISEFLKICVGKDGQYPVDLILCGHAHSNVEFRLEYDEEENFLCYMDFYTANPKEYYPTKHGDSDDAIHVKIKDGAKANGSPSIISDHCKNYTYKVISVPPYNNTLNDSSQPKSWWKTHRPLIIQTASTGPIDTYQRLTDQSGLLASLIIYEADAAHLSLLLPTPTKTKVSFRGYRLFKVENDVIANVKYIPILEETAMKFQLEWLEPILNIMMGTTTEP